MRKLVLDTETSGLNPENDRIIEIAKMFGGKIKYLPPRLGERYQSSIVKTNLSNKILNKEGKIKIKDYISKFKNNTLDDW